MKRNPEIGKELESISPAVANLSFIMPFYVPEGYFESLPQQIFEFIKNDNFIYSETIKTSFFNPKSAILTPFSVPEGYFDGLSANILLKIKETDDESVTAELERISPLLAELERTVPLSLPENYFENLDISSAIIPSPLGTGRIVPMTRKRWINYAAAAVITAFLAGAVYFFMQVTGSTDPVTSKQMAQNEIPVKDSLEVSPEALSIFLSQTEGILSDEMIQMETIGQKDLAILSLTDNNIQEILRDLPDQAIQDYLTEYPEQQPNTNSN